MKMVWHGTGEEDICTDPSWPWTPTTSHKGCAVFNCVLATVNHKSQVLQLSSIFHHLPQFCPKNARGHVPKDNLMYSRSSLMMAFTTLESIPLIAGWNIPNQSLIFLWNVPVARNPSTDKTWALGEKPGEKSISTLNPGVHGHQAPHSGNMLCLIYCR